MSEPVKAVPANIEGHGEPESIRADNFIKLYANSARVETTPWDMKVFFGELTFVAGGKPFIEEFASVVMSPQHVKALLGVLTHHVTQYENMFGKIPLPPSEAPKVEPPKKP